MRRALAAATATTTLALVLAACGGDDASSGSKKSDAPAPDEVSGSLTFWDTSDATNEAPAFKQLVADFEKEYPNVDVTLQSVPFGEAQNKFKTAAEAEQGAPDILRAEVAWVPEFASLGYLYALDGTTVLEDADDYFETPLSSNEFDGKTYGVPQVTDSLALLYNKELFDQAGITEPPTTWAEVETAAQALKKNGVDGIYLNPAGYFLLPFMYGEGGDLVDSEAEEIVVGSDANVAGVSEAVKLIDSGAAPKPPANDAYAAMMTSFTEGKVGMIINGPWEVNNIRNAAPFGGVENLGISAVPGGSAAAGAPVGGHNYVVYSGMDEEKADAALAFVSFMNSAESQAFLAEELGLLPTRKSAYEIDTVADNPIVSAFKPVVDAAVARPWIPEGGQFFAGLDKMAVETMVQGKDPKAALAAVAKTYKAEVVPDYTLAN
ncbi:MAG: extracellular solute-binding protein [Propionibacteriales bacterium]|nr:extracellular solute-binding protein [Propionibacteriales bacterium]